MKTKYQLLFLLVSLLTTVHGQEILYKVDLQPIEIPELGGIQSYAVGQSDGLWLIVGGRLDGLHQRQPFAAFDQNGHPTQIMVVDPGTKEVWKSPLSGLSPKLAEQLSSTNMQFVQSEDLLYLTGGYGFSPTAGDHMTHPYLTIIQVDACISAIKAGEDIAPFIFQQEHPDFAVAGGRMAILEDALYLVGGHLFMGRYNPHGPTHGPGFTQEYTNAVRRFKVGSSTQGYPITWLTSFEDATHLHKRDYNLLPQYRNGEYSLVAYSGVFQPTVDLPFLYPVEIDTDGIMVYDTFVQRFNHYHCPSLPIYDGDEEQMTTVFFGGIAQFYMNDGNLIQDNNVPFVSTIAQVSRSENGKWKEAILSTAMPDYLGAGGEFILKENMNTLEHGIIDATDLASATSVGYIFGGIKSSAPNIFFSNTGQQSSASPTVFEVFLSKEEVTSTDNNWEDVLPMVVYPNPSDGQVFVMLTLSSLNPIDLEFFDATGKFLKKVNYSKNELRLGQNKIDLDVASLGLPQVFLLRAKGERTSQLMKVVVGQ